MRSLTTFHKFSIGFKSGDCTAESIISTTWFETSQNHKPLLLLAVYPFQRHFPFSKIKPHSHQTFHIREKRSIYFDLLATCCYKV